MGKTKLAYQRKPLAQREIALERIGILFDEAKGRFKQDSSLSNRYVEIARKIAMKYKVKIPKHLKARFCKNCHRYLVEGINCRTRVSKGKIVKLCFYCKHISRHPYKGKGGD